MKRKLAAIVFLLLWLLGVVEADEINILFMGNSFTFRHDLPNLVKQVLEEGQPELTVNVEKIVYGDQDLFRHHDLYFSETAVRLSSITIPEIQKNIAVIESLLAMEKNRSSTRTIGKGPASNPSHGTIERTL